MQHRRPSLLRLLSGGAGALGLALLLLAPTASAAPACTGLETKQTRTPTKTGPGRTLRLNYKVRNTGATRDVALGLIVPPSVIVYKKSSSTYRSKHETPTNSSVIDAKLEQEYGVYWRTSTLLNKKNRKYSATFKVAKCAVMPEYLLFQAQLMEIKDNTIVCNKDFAQQKVPVQIPKNYKPHTNTTKAGAVCPVGFQLTDIGYRCAEAKPPTTFLGPKPTVEQCYQYCYNYGGTPAPAYFEYALTSEGSTCACVGATCTRVAAPGSFVLQTLVGTPAPPVPVPEGEYPAVIEKSVPAVSDSLIPVPGVWNNGLSTGTTPLLAKQVIMPITDPEAISAATGFSVAEIPASLYDGPFETAYLQQVDPINSDGRAFTGVYYYPPNESAFNGLLFRDFVLNGMEGSYWYYLLRTHNDGTRAPSYKITVRSPSSGNFTTYVWQPGFNQGSQGPVPIQTWEENKFTENTGTSLPWLTDATGGEGWWCSGRCLVGPEVTLPAQAAIRRSLRTYVETLLSMPTNSSGYQNIQDATITAFRLEIGSGERNVTAFTGNYSVSTPRPNPIYSWAWDFGV